ncbi:MAG TPA: lantibiotic dehydratase C-terminal domain-containing protein [Longimicrobiaceae bacterium]|nr:lantibiotic dehydratase C-terminal domain-containing protein [Longimicrobiaceae bacterium]
MISPDPILTASVYCDGCLDEVIHDVVAPLREGLREHAPRGGWGLWMVRYSKGGCHLKVRLHGPGELRPIAETLLRGSVDRLFASLPPRDPDAPRVSRAEAPPIDEEDQQTADYPDRTLLWTRYRRSHVNLGPQVLLGDDLYVARITTCLARGAETVLDVLKPGLPDSARLQVLLNSVMAGLAALGLPAEEHAAYLVYHRDWLLRFVLSSQSKEAEALAMFDRRVDGMRPVVEQVRRAAEERERTLPAGEGVPAEGTWEHSVRDLAGYLARFRGDPAYHVDPFTDHPAFPSLFKAFHGLANQLGVDMRNEAFVHHLLLRAATDAPADAVVAVEV